MVLVVVMVVVVVVVVVAVVVAVVVMPVPRCVAAESFIRRCEFIREFAEESDVVLCINNMYVVQVTRGFVVLCGSPRRVLPKSHLIREVIHHPRHCINHTINHSRAFQTMK